MQKHRASKHKQLQYHSYAPTTARSNIAGRTTPHNAKARRQMVAYNNAGSSALGMKNNTRQQGKWAHKHGQASEKFPKIFSKIWFWFEKYLIWWWKIFNLQGFLAKMAFPACQAAAWRVTGRSDGPGTVGLVKGLPLYKLDLHVLL